MSTVKIKLSQKVVDKNHQLEQDWGDDVSVSLSAAVSDLLLVNNEVNSAYAYADRYSYTRSSVTFGWWDGTRKVLSGYQESGNDWSGQLRVFSETTTSPGRFKETITGDLLYSFAADGYGSIEVNPLGGTITSYKIDAQTKDPDLGNLGIGLNGNLQLDGTALSGTLNRIYQTGTKHIKLVEATGDFNMTGTSGPGADATVWGTLNTYRENYVDGSYVDVRGTIALAAHQAIDQNFFGVEGNWEGDDDITVELPAYLYETWYISSGMGNDTLTLKGGGVFGKIVAYAGDGDDFVRLLDLNPVVDGGDGRDTLELMVSGSFAAVGAANFEILQLGGRANINATGAASDDTLIGNAGTNTLDGGLGADVLIGGLGNDVYLVDDENDVVTEVARGGIDTVRSTVSWQLGSEIENLVLQAGAGDISATGNALKNTLTGNEGHNRLDGGLGADVMIGGLGNDTYVIDSKSDNVMERVGGGDADRIETSLAVFSLARFAEVEQLVYTGADKSVLTGNKNANVIEGASGADTINGMQGADTMIGGDGNDVFYVDHVLDVVIENVGEGMDTLYTSVSYTVTGDVERIVLTGRTAIDVDIAGGSADTVITGNGAVNRLTALDGNDILDGLDGSDTLTGGLGDDIFRFTAALGARNIDTIADFTSGADSIEIAAKALRWKGAAGTITADQFVVGTAALDADDRFIYDAATGTLSYDADGSGRGKAQIFALLTSNPVLSHEDIVVI